jgi:ClpP class serine protease
MRFNCYLEIETIRKRPLLIYASKFINALPNTPNFIDLSDIDGFTDLVQSLSGQGDSVDVLLHSPGGQPEATERIVHILRNRFNEVHFIVPHSAYSAATMLALSGDSITLHPSATLGLIDPQLNGIPARSIKRGFEKVKEIIKTEGPEALPAYIPLIEKYTLDLLEICEDSEKLSKELVSNWITKYMLKGEENMKIKLRIQLIISQTMTPIYYIQGRLLLAN